MRNRNPQIASVSQDQIKVQIVATGVSVSTDSNPIAQMNFSVETYNNPCNMAEGVRLTQMCMVPPLAWLYNKYFNFFEGIFSYFCCKSSQSENSCTCGTCVMLILYLLFAIQPFVSPTNLAISGLLFLYYLSGVGVYLANHCCKLRGKEYTEKMVPAAMAPPFNSTNEYFDLNAEIVRQYLLANQNSALYARLQNSGSVKFMAYKEIFLTKFVYSIVSPKSVFIHIGFMGLAIIGFIISINAYPQFYPDLRKK